jgi:hypothetical protein
MVDVGEEKWRGPTLSRRASMATVSLNLPRQTRRSWILDAASGVRVKLRTTISRALKASHSGVAVWRCSCSVDKSGKNAPLACPTRQRHAGLRGSCLDLSSSSTLTLSILNILNMAQPALPGDILHVLCEELASQEQFDTLFNCACSSRVLAVPALTHLYRYATVDVDLTPARH